MNFRNDRRWRENGWQIAFVVLASAVAAVMYLASKPAPGSMAVALQAASQNVSRPPYGSVAADSVEGPKHRRNEQLATLSTRLKEATNLRQFSLEAQNSPELGGMTYAMFAARLCRRVAQFESELGDEERSPALPYAATEDSRAYAVRDAAYQKAKAACTGFTEDETGGDSYKLLAQKARTHKDRLHLYVTRVSAVLSSDDMQSRKAVLAAVLEDGDPLLLAMTLDKLISVKATDGASYWIGGKLLAAGEVSTYRSALAVLPCRFGLVCDERSPDVLSSCLKPGQCAGDRIELSRSGMPASRRAEFDATLNVLEAAVRSKQVEHFLP